MADTTLDTVKVAYRCARPVIDNDDPDDEPQVQYADGGTVIIEPIDGGVKVPEGSPVPFELLKMSFTCTIDAEGYLSWQGRRYVRVPDLTSPKLTPVIPSGKATHTVQFRGITFGAQTMNIEQRNVRLAADTVDPETGVCDLVLLTPMPVANSIPVAIGPRGTGIKGVAIQSDGTLEVELTNDEVIDAGLLPVGPGGSDEGVAGYLADPESESAGVLAAKQEAFFVETVYAKPSTGIQAALDSVAQIATEPRYGSAMTSGTTGPVKATVIVPAGVWSIATPLRLPDGVTLVADDRAIIRATSAMDYMIDTDIAVRYSGNGIYGGIWDCNNLAQRTTYVRWAGHFTVDIKQIRNTALHGIVYGDPAAPTPSFEGFIGPVFIVRPNNQAVPAGGIGIWVNNATDCVVGIRKGTIIVGQDIQVRTDGAAHTIDGVHPWGFGSTAANGFASGLTPTTSFYINSSATKLIDCYADGVKAGGKGYHFTANAIATKAFACSAFLNDITDTPDNSADAFYFETGARVALFGPVVRAASSSKRWKTDYAGDLTNVAVFGQSYSEVVTVNRPVASSGYGAWTTYAPDLYGSTTNPNLGTGSTNTGRYRTDGTTVEFNGRIAFGTGSTPGSGNYLSAVAAGYALSANATIVGSGTIYDASTGATKIVQLRKDPSGNARISYLVDGAAGSVTHAVPWAWGDGDVLSFSGRYERA